MAQISQLPLDPHPCIILEPNETFFFKVETPNNWNRMRLAMVCSLTSTGDTNAKFSGNFPQSSSYMGQNAVGKLILSENILNQIVFGFTNNPNQVPWDNNYNGEFIGVRNFPINNIKPVSLMAINNPWPHSFIGGFSFASGQSGNLICFGSQSNNVISGRHNATSPQVFWAHPDPSLLINFHNQNTSNLSHQTENYRGLQIFELEKTGVSDFIFRYFYNLQASYTGASSTKIGPNISLRNNLLLAQRNTGAFSLDISSYTPASTSVTGVFPFCQNLQNGIQRSDPTHFVVQFPFFVARMRIHGILTEFFQ